MKVAVPTGQSEDHSHSIDTDHDYSSNTSASEPTSQHDSLLLEIQRLKRENEQLKVQNSELVNENKSLKVDYSKLVSENHHLKRKHLVVNHRLVNLSKQLKEVKLKYDISSTMMETLNKCVNEVPKKLLEGTAKRVSGTKEKAYHPVIKKFALSLHLCSSKAYR